MSQIEAVKPYRLPNPVDELERAKNDYLYISRNAKSHYWDDEDYWRAEEKAWQRLTEALENLNQ